MSRAADNRWRGAGGAAPAPLDSLDGLLYLVPGRVGAFMPVA